MKILKIPSKTVLLIMLSVALAIVLTACGGNQLDKFVDEINSGEAIHAEFEGLYKVHAETRGNSTIILVFQAELEELATPEVSQIVSDEAASESRAAVEEMRNAGISEPSVILEFLDKSGNLIYVRQFS